MYYSYVMTANISVQKGLNWAETYWSSGTFVFRECQAELSASAVIGWKYK